VRWIDTADVLAPGAAAGLLAMPAGAAGAGEQRRDQRPA